MKTKAKTNFIQGAFILMIAGALVKVVGALFKIPITSLLGSIGYSYFDAGYQIYMFMYIITTAALPVAVSRLVSESNTVGRYENSKRISNVALGTYFIFGAILSLTGILFSKQLAMLINPNAPEAGYAIAVISVSLIFEVILASQWGYFQGFSQMMPTAATQLIIAAGKLGVGLFLANYLMNKGYTLPIVAAGAIGGTTFGTLVGAVYIWYKRMTFRPQFDIKPASKQRDSVRDTVAKLLRITVPIALGSCMLGITNLVDLAMIQRRLGAAGFSPKEVLILNGSYKGPVITLFQLPSALIVPLGVAIVPSVAASLSVGRLEKAKKIIASSLRLTILLAMPAGFGFLFMAKPIISLVYSSSKDFNQMILYAPRALSQLGIGVIFISLALVMNTMLQALGKERAPVVTMFVGGVLKITVNYILVGNPSIHIFGASIGTDICYGVIMILNLIVLKKTLGSSLHFWRELAKPLMCSVVSCGSAALLHSLLSNFFGGKTATILSIGFAAVFYFGLMIFSRGILAEDIELLPKGDKIKAFFKKRGLFVI